MDHVSGITWLSPIKLKRKKKKTQKKLRGHRQEVFQMSFSLLVFSSSKETDAKQFGV